MATRNYTVLRGDTLSSISRKCCNAPSAWPGIAEMNHLKAPYRIFVGQSLLLPAAVQSSSALPGLQPSKAQPAADSPAILVAPLSLDIPFEMQVIEVQAEGGVATMKWEGKIQVQATASHPEISLDTRGKAEWSRLYATGLGSMTSKLGVSADLKTRKAEISVGYEVHIGANVVELKVTPVSAEYTVKTRAFQFNYAGLQYSGEMSVQVKIKYQRPGPRRERVRVLVRNGRRIRRHTVFARPVPDSPFLRRSLILGAATLAVVGFVAAAAFLAPVAAAGEAAMALLAPVLISY